MTDLTPGEKQDGLAYSQAACYAAMSAKEHREGSAQATQMLRLTVRLVDLALAAFDGTAPVAAPVPGEPTLADIVEQTKAAAAAGQPAPQVVVDLIQASQATTTGNYGPVADNPIAQPIEALSPEIEPSTAPTIFDPVADYKPLPV